MLPPPVSQWMRREAAVNRADACKWIFYSEALPAARNLLILLRRV